MSKLLMIGTDEKIFEKDSAVRLRQIEYAKNWEEVHIIIFSKKKNKEEILSNNCFAHSTNSILKILCPFDAIRKSISIIKNKNITNITTQDPFLTAITGGYLKNRFKNIIWEIQIHTDVGSPNYTYKISNKIRKIISNFYIPKADAIRVVSEKIKQYVVKMIKGKNIPIEIRPIFVDTENIKKLEITIDLHKKYPNFQKIILMASRLEEEKNIELAILACKKVFENNKETGLVIVGDGSKKRSINKLIYSLGVQKNIVIENWVDSNTLYSYYKTADIFLNTSLFEGYGMTLIEAKASGITVITTDVGVARDIGAIIVDFSADSICDTILNNLK